MRRHLADDRGVASVLVIACAAVLLVVGCGLTLVAATVVDHRRAQLAADLAALAGAAELQRGGDGCGDADRVAAANGARLDDCRVDGRDVLVRVTVTGPRWLGLGADLRGRPAPVRLRPSRRPCARTRPLRASRGSSVSSFDSRRRWNVRLVPNFRMPKPHSSATPAPTPSRNTVRALRSVLSSIADPSRSNTAATITTAPNAMSSRPSITMAAGYSRADGACASKASSRTRAPPLSSGWFWLPHFGDWTHDGHPSAQVQSAMVSRVARSQSAAAR